MTAQKKSDGADGAARINWLWQNLIGQLVQVELEDGTVVEGLLNKKKENGMGLELSFARRKISKKVSGSDMIQAKTSMDIKTDKVRKVVCIDVQLFFENNTVFEGGGNFGAERELVRWTGGEEGEVLNDRGYSAGDFDQFKTNEEKFGVKSTYSEDFYTTKLDKSKLTEEQKLKAEKKAKEIEKGSGGRGGKYDSIAESGDWADDFDEETLHSAVIRESDPVSVQQFQKRLGARELLGAGSQSSYVPPHLRHQQQAQQQPQQPAQPIQQQQPQVQPQQPAQQQPQQPVQTTLNPHVLAQSPQLPAYRQEGQLQVRQDSGGPLGAVLPADCYNEGQPSPPPPHPVAAQPTSPQVQQQQPQQVQLKPAPKPAVAAAIDPNKRQVNPKPATVKPLQGAGLKIGAAHNLPRVTETPPVSRKQEILAFKKDGERLDKVLAAKKKEASASTSSANGATEKPKEQPKEEAVAPLNPNATPYNKRVEEEKAEVKPFEPAPEPVWCPPLEDGKTRDTRFIAQIIANAIYERVKSRDKLQEAGKTGPLPIPGDAESFTHEWQGDDYYWDEEDDECGAGLNRSTTMSKGVHGQTLPQQSSQPMRHAATLQQQRMSQVPQYNPNYPQGFSPQYAAQPMQAQQQHMQYQHMMHPQQQFQPQMQQPMMQHPGQMQQGMIQPQQQMMHQHQHQQHHQHHQQQQPHQHQHQQYQQHHHHHHHHHQAQMQPAMHQHQHQHQPQNQMQYQPMQPHQHQHHQHQHQHHQHQHQQQQHHHHQHHQQQHHQHQHQHQHQPQHQHQHQQHQHSMYQTPVPHQQAFQQNPPHPYASGFPANQQQGYPPQGQYPTYQNAYNRNVQPPGAIAETMQYSVNPQVAQVTPPNAGYMHGGPRPDLGAQLQAQTQQASPSTPPNMGQTQFTTTPTYTNPSASQPLTPPAQAAKAGGKKAGRKNEKFKAVS